MKQVIAVATAGLVLSAPLWAWAGETQRVEGLVFDRVLVWGSPDVEILQGEEPGLKMQGSESDLAKKPFYVDGKTLVVGRSESGWKKETPRVKYRISAGDLQTSWF